MHKMLHPKADVERLYIPRKDGELDSEFRQDIFTQDDYHYLNVPVVGSFTVDNTFDCTLKCLRNACCFSVNLAAYRGANGKIWCELLSSEKHSNPEKYKRNQTSHHLSTILETSGTHWTCCNEHTCAQNSRHLNCPCHEGIIGASSQIAIKSCQDWYQENPDDKKPACLSGLTAVVNQKVSSLSRTNKTQMITIIFDSKPTSVLCQMGDFGCGNGGWTPVMKMDGNKQTFEYSSPLWSNNETFNLDGGKTGFDSQETKLPSYWNTSFSKICLGMKINDNQSKFIVINKQANSLYSLIADGQYRKTSLGRDKWKSLIGSEASLQKHCNKEGFNAVGGKPSNSKARIGIISNQQNDCASCDSRIGFGTGGKHDKNNSCGNEATIDSDNGDKHIKRMGYILVQ
ncbi:uncharacterized protein [Porites lutea]|uniref:uncharacterized protein n=2 Tax=Porites lutea TaxID=51062 RepID=UPI003CC5F1B0